MNRMKAISAILLLFVTLGAGSCARDCPCRTFLFARTGDNLLSTGLVGWQQIGGSQDSWHFQDGILYTEGENGGWLATVRPYDDFQLSLEFRVPPGGNSGVFIRSPLEGDPAYTGMEIQILDDYAEQYRSLNPYQYTGSLYGVQAPSERVATQAGQWQKMVVTARGPRIKVVLNGHKIINTKTTYYQYKTDSHPGLTRDGGYIGLQNHGSRVEFRNIRIQVL